MKKLISLIMVFCIMCGFSVRAEEALSANAVLKFNNPGNVYFTGDTENMSATYFNNSASDMNLNIKFAATGRKLGAVWSYKTSVYLASYKSMSETIHIDFAKDIGVYDIYDLVITLSDGNQKKTITTEFSYAKRGVKNEKFGVNTHFASIDYAGYIDKSMSLLKNSGVSMVRDSLPDWANYETVAGTYKIPATYKNTIDKLVENDIGILNVLAYGNTLYTGSNGGVKIPVTSNEVTAFKNYVERYVSETKDKINYFEVWNEPNATGFNTGGDNGTGYGNLVKEVYPVIKTANPNAYVLGYSSSGLNDNINKTASTGAYNYMDAASFHPYSEYTTDGWWDTIWATGDHLPEDRTTDYFSKFRTRAQKQNIWVTEQGWSDGDNKNSEALQAAYLVRAYTLSMADGSVEKYFWYEFIRSALYGDGHEGKFGMLNGRLQNVPLGARPVFMAMSNMNSKLANAEVLTYSDKNYVHKCDFEKKDGNELFVIWLETKKEADTKSAYYDFGTTRVLKTDLYGNEEILTSENGIYTIEAGCDPVYIEPLAELPEKFEYSYDTKEGICTVKGYIDSKTQNVPVNLMLYRPYKTYEDLKPDNTKETVSYFDECVSMLEGVYEFEFAPSDGEGVYLLKLATEDGEVFETYIDLRSNLTCTAEVKDKSIDDIKTGERFSVKVSVTGENKVYKEYNVYVALFNGDKLVKVCGKPGEVMDDVLSNVTELEMTADCEFDTIKAFAWEPDMKPIGKSVTIPKTK